MKAKSHSLGSEAASFNPANVLVLAFFPTVSRAIRDSASSLSSGVSQRVVDGSSGKVKMAAIATASVAAP